MTPFSLILNLLTHYFHQNFRSDWVKFVSHAEPRYQIFDEVPPPNRADNTPYHHHYK